MASRFESSRPLNQHTFTSKPEEDKKEGRGPLGPRSRLRTSDYKRDDSCHEPTGRSRERAPRGSSVHRPPFDFAQDGEFMEPRPDGSAPEELSRESNDAMGEPIKVKVVLMGELQRWAGKQEVAAELPSGSSVQTLVARLSELCGEAFARKALSKEGRLQPHIAVFINGIQMGKLDGTRTILTGGRVELMLLPVYEGG